MISARRVCRLEREENGGVLVAVVLFMPVLVLMVMFVVDVANWFEHKRHLQLQADAAVFAAAGDFRADGCDNDVIEQTARDYHGDLYNEQVSGRQPSVHFMLNSRTYFGQLSPTDDTVDTDRPCEAKMIDVKLTETDLPWFFKVAQVPFINAHARVEFKRITRATGALPVGVPDVNPRSARVEFIEEGSSGPRVLGTRPLDQTGVANGLAIWDNAAAPLPVTVDAEKIGVRVILGGASSTTCGDPLVQCYDLTDPGRGIIYVRGWSSAGSGAQPNAPKDRSVTLFNGTCADPYFSASGSSCTVGVRAHVEFGTSDPVNLLGASLTAVAGGAQYPLSFVGGDTWETQATIPVAPGAGPVPVELKWEETKGNQGGNACKTSGNKCKGTFGVVHRAFGASEALSGPIKLAQVWENGSFWANSFERCGSCTHDLVVKIGVAGNLKNASDVNDPIVALRVVGGSQNQSLDCDPGQGTNLKFELANGCAPKYELNQGTACPDATEPFNCVPLQTGTDINAVPAGLNLRILGAEKPTACTSPNHWSDFPDLDSGDPRLLQVFLTPFGSFDGSGNDSVPVTDFGAFYVTGWAGKGSGFANPCEGNGDDPAAPGYIVGHFIKYISSLNDGDSGDELCDFNAFGGCVAVLTE